MVSSVVGSIRSRIRALRGGQARGSESELDDLLASIPRLVASGEIAELEQLKKRAFMVALQMSSDDAKRGEVALRRSADALKALPGEREAYLLAEYNLGAVVRDSGRLNEARVLWSTVLEREPDPRDKGERFARSVIEYNYSNLLKDLASAESDPSRLTEALRVLDELVARERGNDFFGTRERVERAALNRVMVAMELGLPDRTQASLDDLRKLADEWDSDELRATAEAMSVDLARAEEIARPWASASRAERESQKAVDEEPDDEEASADAAADALHQEALARVAAHHRLGEPFILLLRSFGHLRAQTYSIHDVPVVQVQVPGASLANPGQRAVVEWLEHRALVVSVAQRGEVLLSPEDPFPRLALGSDWFSTVQHLMIRAEGIVVVAEEVTAGLKEEFRAIKVMARCDDTIIFRGPDLPSEAFGPCGHEIAWEPTLRSVQRDRQLLALLRRVEKIHRLPVLERIAASDVASRRRQERAAVHQKELGSGDQVLSAIGPPCRS
jgi:tetratricopeptide (TPR) repeat protein